MNRPTARQHHHKVGDLVGRVEVPVGGGFVRGEEFSSNGADRRADTQTGILTAESMGRPMDRPTDRPNHNRVGDLTGPARGGLSGSSIFVAAEM